MWLRYIVGGSGLQISANFTDKRAHMHPATMLTHQVTKEDIDGMNAKVKRKPCYV